MRVSSLSYVLVVASIVGGIGLVSSVRKDRSEVRTAERGDETPALVETVRALRSLHTERFDTNIPPGAKGLLRVLKEQLETSVSRALAGSDAASASPSDLEVRINAELRAEGVLSARDGETGIDDHHVDRGYDYGDVYDVKIVRPADSPDLLAVTTSIGVCCGEDTSFYLYRGHSDGWSLALAYTAAEYDEVDGARGLFQFGVSPPDAHGNVFVVVADVNPWCSSNWQTLRYAVLREGPSPHDPAVLLSEEHSIFLGNEPAYVLDVRKSSFRLRFADEKFMDLMNDGESVSPDDDRAKRHLAYRVSGSDVTKTVDR